MKIRTNFVSNSSSSSFIVFLDKTDDVIGINKEDLFFFEKDEKYGGYVYESYDKERDLINKKISEGKIIKEVTVDENAFDTVNDLLDTLKVDYLAYDM